MGGKLVATRCYAVMHCCVISFPVELSNLCQELAMGKGFVSVSAMSAGLAISAHSL